MSNERSEEERIPQNIFFSRIMRPPTIINIPFRIVEEILNNNLESDIINESMNNQKKVRHFL